MNKTDIVLEKYVQTHPVIATELERGEVHHTMDSAVASFTDCFEHHIGRKPSKKQIEKIKSFEEVTVKCKGLNYIFIFT